MKTTNVVKRVVMAGIAMSLLMLPLLAPVPAYAKAKKGDDAQQILVAGDPPLTRKMGDEACKSYFFRLGEGVGVNLSVTAETKALCTQTLVSYYSGLSSKEKRTFLSQVKSEKLVRQLWPLLPKDAQAQHRQQWANEARESVMNLGTQIVRGLQKTNVQDRSAALNQLNPVALVTLKIVAYVGAGNDGQGQAVREYAGSLLRAMGLPAPPAAPSYDGGYNGQDDTDSSITAPRQVPNYSGQSNAMAEAFRAGQGSGSMTSRNYGSSGRTGSYGTSHW